MKNGERNDLSVLQNFVGKRIIGVDFVPSATCYGNNVVFTFGDSRGAVAKLHIGCFARVRTTSDMLFTVSDEYFSEDLQKLPFEKYVAACNGNYEGTLIMKNCERLRRNFDDPAAAVTSVVTNDVGDINIMVGINDFFLDILPDCIGHDHEYYRVEFLNSQHTYALRNFRGRNLFEKIC